MNCPCHQQPMYWNKDRRYERGGFWKCREKKRELNAKRVNVFGTRIYMPDEDFKQFTLALLAERKEQHGRT